MPMAVLLVTALVAVNETAYVRSENALKEARAAAELRQSVRRLTIVVLEAETNQRAYLLTSKPEYLQGYKQAVSQVGQVFNAIRDATLTDPTQITSLSQLSRSVQRKLTEMDLTLRFKDNGQDQAWQSILAFDIGREQMEAIRQSAQKMLDDANVDLQESTDRISQSLLISRIGISLVGLLLLLAFFFYTRKAQALAALQARNQHMLEEVNRDLDRQVQDRTAELLELTTYLQRLQEQEREHLARELHDELGALLTSAKMDVARLKMKLTEALNGVVALKRRIIEDLRPSALNNLGLQTALEILVREFAARSGLDVDVSIDPLQTSEDTQLTIYRLVQEALTNIAKYAQAQHVRVSLSRYPQHVEVRVHDDGQGFDPEALPRGTHGLTGMRHRIQALQGTLKIHSQHWQGTRIEAIIPLDAETEALAAPASPLN